LPDACYCGGKSLRRVDPLVDGVTAVFDDGSCAEGELLIAADGLHSTARAQFLPDVSPRYAGYVAWRGVVQPEGLVLQLRKLASHHMLFGLLDGEVMLSIPMPATQDDGDRTCHFVWFRPATEDRLIELCTDASGRRHGISIAPPLIRAELIAQIRRDAEALLAPQLAALVNAAPQIMLQPIFDLEVPRMVHGRIALLGDAAFVARPHVASGVMKAAVDAETLADALASASDIDTALQRYNDLRRPYGTALVERGRHIGATIVTRTVDPERRAEILMREYGSAGLVRDRPIAARVGG
jgi:2-polyprenyl-6-methoxyphenol hydroxylase-like FAD-dependent oxidoreductase